jgi:serine protease AprX
MMTSVVAAGNGRLSQGLYRGVAPESRLVLLKVMREDGRIGGEQIASAIRWAVAHRKTYDIRIINLSLGGDGPSEAIDRAVAEAIAAGIVVVAAAGNDPAEPVLPPASSPDALTIGGLDDRNTLDPLQIALYHSTSGQTPDGLFKPELIAPAIWIAAPLLPETPQQREAELLLDLWNTDDGELASRLTAVIDRLPFDADLPALPPTAIRDALGEAIDRRRYISAHYEHVDGTSFAAPIACGVIAQMLQANPRLTPAQIREHLLGTARPLPQADGGRQGYGVLQPAQAVRSAAGDDHDNPWQASPYVDYRRRRVAFYLHAPAADSVGLAGSFNDWRAVPLHRNGGDEWTTEIDLPPPGAHPYKFVVDNRDWRPDPRSRYRAPDGFNGFNSELIVE